MGQITMPAPAGGQPAKSPEPKVLFEFRHSQVSDADYSVMFDRIASAVPYDGWPTVKITKSGDGFERVVDRYYDVFADSGAKPHSQRLPRTTLTMVDLIRKANPELQGDALPMGYNLKIPPVPARPMTHASGDKPFTISGGQKSPLALETRLFDPDHNAYALNSLGFRPTSEVSEWNKTGTATRGTSATAIVVSLSMGLLLANLGVGVAYPLDAIEIQFLQSPQCASPDAVLAASPYLELAKAHLASGRADLVKGAAAHKLALIDFNFTNGHGSKVLNTAEWLLDKLGVPELVKAGLEPVELGGNYNDNSSSKYAKLIWETLNRYAAVKGKAVVTQVSILSTSHYLLTVNAAAQEPTLTLPSVVVQAAIWDQLQLGRWLNLSWTTSVTSGALPDGIEDQLKPGNAFIAVAAGNDRRAVRSDRSPQSAASSFTHFANVTYGDADGYVRGSWTGSQGGRVDLSAPGCGYAYKNLKGEAGSSLASPIVATSAWLKHLRDKTSASDMRAELMHASSLLPRRDEGVHSSGVFDPARLLANVGPHYVTKANNQVVTLQDPEITTDAEACKKLVGDPKKRGKQDVIVYEEKGKFFLLRRTPAPDFPFVRVHDACEVKDVRLDAVVNGVRQNIAGSLADFIKLVRQAAL
jgi:hypothetical protein